MGNIFSQTDDLYQPEPALQLVPVTPSQGNALRGGASRHLSRERAFNLPDANVRRLHQGSKLALVTARPVYRQGKALRALPAAASLKGFRQRMVTGQGQDQREEAWEAWSKTFNNRFGFERGLWRRKIGWFAGAPETSVFEKIYKGYYARPVESALRMREGRAKGNSTAWRQSVRHNSILN